MAGDVDIAGLLARFEEREAALVARLEACEAELASLRSAPAHAAGPVADEVVGRRQLLRLAGGAAAGAAAVTVAGLASARPAAAAAGQPVVQGQSNSVGAPQTSVSSSSAAPNGTFRADNTSTGHGVIGIANNVESAGVYGRNHRSVGVRGVSQFITGVVGEGNVGVVGTGVSVGVSGSGSIGMDATGKGVGLQATTSPPTTGYGIIARGDVGVFGEGASIGGAFYGTGAALLLLPRSSVGAPTTGSHHQGEIVIDSAGSMWVCITGGDTGGVWKKVVYK